MSAAGVQRCRFYGDLPIVDPARFLREARAALKGVRFDTVVGTGMSGVPAATLLGRHMRKNILLVRKEDDKHNHHDSTGSGVVGQFGYRWIFVDDFISSGETRNRVLGVIAGISPAACYVGTYAFSPLYAGWHPARDVTI